MHFCILAAITLKSLILGTILVIAHAFYMNCYLPDSETRPNIYSFYQEVAT